MCWYVHVGACACPRQISGTHVPRARAERSVVASDLLFPCCPSPGGAGPEDAYRGSSLLLAQWFSARDNSALQGTCASVGRKSWLSQLETEVAPGIYIWNMAQHPPGPRTAPPQRVTQSRREQGAQKLHRRGCLTCVPRPAASTSRPVPSPGSECLGASALCPHLTGSSCGLNAIQAVRGSANYKC